MDEDHNEDEEPKPSLMEADADYSAAVQGFALTLRAMEAAKTWEQRVHIAWQLDGRFDFFRQHPQYPVPARNADIAAECERQEGEG